MQVSGLLNSYCDLYRTAFGFAVTLFARDRDTCERELTTLAPTTAISTTLVVHPIPVYACP